MVPGLRRTGVFLGQLWARRWEGERIRYGSVAVVVEVTETIAVGGAVEGASIDVSGAANNCRD